MRIDKLTIKSRDALEIAQKIAQNNHSQQITPLHLLAALLSQGEGVVVPILKRLGIEPELVLERVNERIRDYQRYQELRLVKESIENLVKFLRVLLLMLKTWGMSILQVNTLCWQ